MAAANPQNNLYLLCLLTQDLELQVEPVALAAHNTTSSCTTEVLTQWKDLPAIEAMWQSAYIIQEQFPSFLVEDNVKLWGGVLSVIDLQL